MDVEKTKEYFLKELKKKQKEIFELKQKAKLEEEAYESNVENLKEMINKNRDIAISWQFKYLQLHSLITDLVDKSKITLEEIKNLHSLKIEDDLYIGFTPIKKRSESSSSTEDGKTKKKSKKKRSKSKKKRI